MKCLKESSEWNIVFSDSFDRIYLISILNCLAKLSIIDTSKPSSTPFNLLSMTKGSRGENITVIFRFEDFAKIDCTLRIKYACNKTLKRIIVHALAKRTEHMNFELSIVLGSHYRFLL